MLPHALQSPSFRVFLGGVLVSAVGGSMQIAAVNWVGYKLADDSRAFLGGLGLSRACAVVIGTPLGGAVADRVPLKRATCVLQYFGISLSLGLASLTWFGGLRPWHLVAAHFMTSLLVAADNGIRQVLIPSLVPRRSLQSALSLAQLSFMFPSLVGPALAGFLIEETGPAPVFVTNAVSFLAIVIALHRIPGLERRGHATDSPFPALAEGFWFAASDRRIAALLVLAVVLALFAQSYSQLVPMFANALRTGAQGYGELMFWVGAGTLFGAASVGSIPECERKGRWLLAAGGLQSIAIAVLATSRSFGAVAGSLFVASVGRAVGNTMIATMVQTTAPVVMRGRIMAIYWTVFTGVPYFGAFVLTGTGLALADPLPMPDSTGMQWTAIGSHLGEDAGVARAMVLGAIIVSCMLLFFAPWFWRRSGVGDGLASTNPPQVLGDATGSRTQSEPRLASRPVLGRGGNPER